MKECMKGLWYAILCSGIVIVFFTIFPLIRYAKSKINLYQAKKDLNNNVAVLTKEYEDIAHDVNTGDLDQEELDTLYARLIEQEKRIRTLQESRLFSYAFAEAKHVHLQHHALQNYFWGVLENVQFGTSTEITFNTNEELIASYNDTIDQFLGNAHDAFWDVSFYDL